MRQGLSSFRARMAASVTALLGLSAVSACSPRAVSDADRTIQPVPTQQPVTIQQPTAAPVTTFAIGEEEGSVQPTYNSSAQPNQPVFSDQRATTFAIGEEDGFGGGAGSVPEVEGDFERIYIPPAPGEGQATTFAIGEEG